MRKPLEWLRQPDPPDHLLNEVDQNIRRLTHEDYAPPYSRPPIPLASQYNRQFRALEGETPLDVMALLLVNLTFRDMKKLGEELQPLLKDKTSARDVTDALHEWAEKRVERIGVSDAHSGQGNSGL